MRPAYKALALLLEFAPPALGDWPMFGADAQRTGWAARETLINRNNAGTLELKWKIKLDNAPKELTSLTAPIVVDQVKIPHERLASRNMSSSGGGSSTTDVIFCHRCLIPLRKNWPGANPSLSLERRRGSPERSARMRSMPRPPHRPPGARKLFMPFPVTEGFTH